MFEWVLLLIGVLGFGYAGYSDLRTTEFPDWIPYSMIVLALVVRGVWAFLEGNAWILLESAIVGCAFLGFGLLLYFLKQWGDGDGWLLGALGFLFPYQPAAIVPVKQMMLSFPYPLTVLFNFFVISFVYIIVYTFLMGLKSPKIIRGFRREFRGSVRSILSVFIVFTLACLGVVFGVHFYMGIPLAELTVISLFPVLLLGILIFVEYGKYIETEVFKRKVPASKLRVGDVPVGHKWRVLTEEEIKKLRKRGGSVWIKEGVRLVPVFLITLLVNVFWGFLLLL